MTKQGDVKGIRGPARFVFPGRLNWQPTMKRRGRSTEVVLAAVFAAAAFGQSVTPADAERVFHFSNSGTLQDLQEMATTIRSIADIRQAALDPALRDFTVHGTAEQIALAQGMFNELDKSLERPVQAGPHSVSPEFRLSTSGDNVVRLFYVPNAATARDLQEVATMMRAMGEIRRVFTCNAPRAVALRGTDEQLALAEWLLTDLDRHGQGLAAAPEGPTTREFRLSGADDVVRVYYATHTATVQDFQEVATLVRSIAEIRRVFTYNTPRAITLRGTAEQLALAEWLFAELKQPVNGQPPETPEFHLTGGGDDVVRVFYLMNNTTLQQLQDIIRSVRTETNILRAFTYNAPRAVALRGTGAQIAMAQQLLKEQIAAQP